MRAAFAPKVTDSQICCIFRVKSALQDTYSFQLGDSAEQLSRGTWTDFFAQMDKAISLEMTWTLILKDPLANSFIAPSSEETELNDPLLEIRDYVRSAEEDEEYGIDHLKAHRTGLETDSSEEDSNLKDID